MLTEGFFLYRPKCATGTSSAYRLAREGFGTDCLPKVTVGCLSQTLQFAGVLTVHWSTQFTSFFWFHLYDRFVRVDAQYPPERPLEPPRYRTRLLEILKVRPHMSSPGENVSNTVTYWHIKILKLLTYRSVPDIPSLPDLYRITSKMSSRKVELSSLLNRQSWLEVRIPINVLLVIETREIFSLISQCTFYKYECIYINKM